MGCFYFGCVNCGGCCCWCLVRAAGGLVFFGVCWMLVLVVGAARWLVSGVFVLWVAVVV